MPFVVPFLFHPCGSHPGGCDTSLAKRQDTKWSADDFGHNLGVAASGKKLPKDLSTQGQVFSCDTRKSVIEVLLCCGFQGSSAASESDLLDSWFKYKYGWGCFFNKSFSFKPTHKKGQQRMCLWVIELNCFIANLISLNRLLGWLDLCIPVWQSTVLFFADVVAVLCCIGPYKPTSYRPKHVHSGQLYLEWSWQIMTTIGSCSLWQSISLGRIWDSQEPEASEKCNGIHMDSKQRQPTKGSQSQQLCFFKFEWNSWALHKQCSMGLVDLQW